MKKYKFTKGPFSLGRLSINGEDSTHVFCPNGHRLASSGFDNIQFENSNDTPVAENMHLFKCAPDMVTAIEMLLETISSAAPTPPHRKENVIKFAMKILDELSGESK